MPDFNFAALKANYQPTSQEKDFKFKGRIIFQEGARTPVLDSLNLEIKPYNSSDISLANSVLHHKVRVSGEGVFSLGNFKINTNSDKILNLTLSDPKNNFRQTTVNLVLPAKTLDQREVSLGNI